MEIDKLLIFEIGGKFAQFKKFYTNSSSLTYPIPPRTVLMGMVASILEENRDEYYNWLSPSNSKFGIKIINGGYGI
jgi:CRISPR-associated protein Cas5h